MGSLTIKMLGWVFVIALEREEDEELEKDEVLKEAIK